MSRLAVAVVVLALGACATRDIEPDLVDQLAAYDLVARVTERGVVVYIPDVLFDFDSTELTAVARDQIVGVAEVIGRLAPERTVSVEGHADARGTDEYNHRLSLERAQEVATVLTGHGLEPTRVRTTGFGESFPVQPNENPDGTDSAEGRRQNRRVEVVIER